MKKERLIGLDVLRILSALVIFAFHSISHIGANYGQLNGFFSMGAIFMTAFFMLSGLSLSLTTNLI